MTHGPQRITPRLLPSMIPTPTLIKREPALGLAPLTGLERDACAHELFERQVERTPDAAALLFADAEITYAQLNARANRLAHHLRALGVGPEVRVGVCVEPGLEMMVGVLGVLKAGGAYLPLDPAYPEDRLGYMLQDSAPAVLLTQGSLAGRFAGLHPPTLDLDAREPAWASAPETNPAPESVGLTAGHPCYVIYTSGSTGRPKGVRVEHRALVSTLGAAGGAFGFGPGDRVHSLASFAFDIWLFESLLPLLAGGSVRLVARERVLDLPRLVADLSASTAVHAVPSLMRRIVEEVRSTPGGALPGVRRVFVGGETVAPELLEEMRGIFPAAEIHVLYGPTEGTIICAAHRLGRDPARLRMVGRPLGNAALHVLDAEGSAVRVGTPGELCLGGRSVARDYLGRPALTAERFVPDPFSAEPGARLYRTGDRVRRLASGEMEFLGRTDRQVKVRGYRIEPGEIEGRLEEHPGVREAAVEVREDAPGDARLVAYFVGGAEAESLRSHLLERLPEYMVPAAYVRLEAFPLTPNGKLDRRALPAPDGDAYARRGHEAPVGETEAALAGIWAEVLGVERVGRWDDFFELGGHSLLAVRVVSRVRERLDVEVPLGELFRRPTLAEYARGAAAARGADLPRIEPADRAAPLPLSFAQQRLWFLERMGGMGNAYHLPWRLRLRGALDAGALRRALERIVARHEALRTTFPLVDGGPVQWIAPVDESRFHLLSRDLLSRDLGGRPEAEIQRVIAEAMAAPFDLERGPLIRGTLVRLGEDDHALLVTMHHIVSDGWSMGVLAGELSALYAAFRRGDVDPLPPLPVQYADYAAWQRRWMQGDVLREQAEHWRRTLAGAPELLELPAGHPRPAHQDHAGASLEVELDEELASGLKALGRRRGTTLFMTLLAGWAVVLSRLSGQDDVVIGTPTANRGRGAIEGLIGFFVNTLALRLDLSGSPTVAELLGRVKERALEAQHHQDIPFEQVVELAQPARSLAHSPLFQVMFAWQNAPAGDLSLAGLDVAAMGGGAEEASAPFDLSLSLGESGGRIVGEVQYATALYDRGTVERYLGYLRRVLEAMAREPERRIGELGMLSGAERARLVEWNAAEPVDPPDACAHELFERQVERTPDAAALLFADEEITYAQLNARANRVAHHLRAVGVGPEVRVGVCVEPSLEMMVGVLGVLKAGGAYVPLDPAYPEDRLGYMLADSAPAVLLTQSSLAGRLAGVDLPTLDLNARDAAWASGSETNPARAGLTAGHPCYVIYTSGSTGRPKGVRVEHRALVSTLAAAGRAFGFGPADRVHSLASFAFDIWLFESLLPLLSGSSVRLVAREQVLDPPRLVADLSASTAVHAVPSLMRRIVEEARDTPEGALPGVRRVFVGGEAVAPELLEEMRRIFPAAEIHVLYGPTEGTIVCAAHRLGTDVSRRRMVGRPLGNAALHVLDAGGSLVPIGTPGELCLGGRSVARDYLARPALTSERFVPDPFSAEPGARLYRTGDRVRRLASGELEFLGRTDRQVKVRGYRIEPGEIEARLMERDGVREAAVEVREDAGDRRLVAYWAGSDEVEVERLRAHLLERLPEYMVPAAYVRLEALPLTPNGKVDRAALPAPEGDAYARRGYEAPMGETEAALAGVWAEVLGVERVGRWDHFFDLGGHSLLASRLVSRVQQVLEVDLALSDVFERPVMSLLAQQVLDAQLAQFDTAEIAQLTETVRSAGGG